MAFRPLPALRRPFYGWYIVGACVAMNFYLSLAYFQGFQAFFLPILQEFGWSRTSLSGAFSLRQLESGIMAPAVGFLVDRFGARRIILLGVLIGGGGIMALGQVDSIWTFYAVFLAISVGTSGASHGISWPVIISNWFHRLRGRALGIAFLGPVVSGPFVVSIVLLEEAVGWRAALTVLGAGFCVVGVPLALLERPRPEPYGYLPDGAQAPEPVPVASQGDRTAKEDPDGGARAARERGVPVSAALRVPAFWLLVGIFGIHGLGVSGVMVHQLPLFEELGFDAREGAVVLGLIFFLSGIGRLGAGTLLDFFDHRVVLVGVLALQTGSYLLLAAITPSWWQVVLFALLFGAAFGSTIPARPLLVGRSSAAGRSAPSTGSPRAALSRPGCLVRC